jgi:hypothetical protein
MAGVINFTPLHSQFDHSELPILETIDFLPD